MAMMVMHPPIDRLAALVTFLVPHVNEVVIVDTGSSDEDIDIMRSWNYNDGSAEVRVLHRNFVNFSHTRNEGLADITSEWTLIIDPDELPSIGFMEHMKEVTSPEWSNNIKNKRVRAFTHLSLNWWAGRLGPEMPYHWHVRLWRTKGTYMYRPIHELVMVNGQAEGQLRGTPELPKAPRQAYVIHSKGAQDIVHSDNFYKSMGDKSNQ